MLLLVALFCLTLKWYTGADNYGPRIIVRTIKQIQKGEEVTITYTDLLQPTVLFFFSLFQSFFLLSIFSVMITSVFFILHFFIMFHLSMQQYALVWLHILYFFVILWCLIFLSFSLISLVITTVECLCQWMLWYVVMIIIYPSIAL